MDIKCPHCGVEYEVEKQDMYRYTTCEICGKGFVIGATSSLLSSAEEMPATHKSASNMSAHATSPVSSVPRSRPFAGRMGIGVPRHSGFSAKLNLRNPFVWGVITLACLIVLVFAAMSKNDHNKSGKVDTNLAQEESMENSIAIEAQERFKIKTSPATDSGIATEDIQVASPQASNPLYGVKDKSVSVVNKNDDDDYDDDAIVENVLPATSVQALPKFAGHTLGEVYDGDFKIDPCAPKCFTLKKRLEKEAGPFMGYDAEFGYTVKEKRLAYVAICNSNSRIDAWKEYSEIEKRLYAYYSIRGERKEYYDSGKKRSGFFGVNGLYDTGGAYEKTKGRDQEVKPIGVRLNGVIYGTYMTGHGKYMKAVACVADIKLLNTLENELIEIQDKAIARQKSATTASTLKSFCGIKFGEKQSFLSEESVRIDGETYKMPWTNRAKCNRFRCFGCDGWADAYGSRDKRVFLVYMKKDGDAYFGVEDDGSLNEEAQKCVDIFTAKYGKPYLLKEGSRYCMTEPSRYSGPSRIYLFPVGYSSVYLHISKGGSDRGLYCINDIEAQKAVACLAQSKKNNMIAGYNEFTAGDFLGVKFGGPSPYRSRDNGGGWGVADDGTIEASPEFGLHSGLCIDFKCRKIASMNVWVTCTSHKVAKVLATFDPLEGLDEEFDSLCAMCERKLNAKRQIGKSSSGRSLATIANNDIIVTIERGYPTQFKAVSIKMLRLANDEVSALRKKKKAAAEALLPGIDAVDGPLQARHDEYEPTPEEKAAEEDTLRNARLAAEEGAAMRRKGDLNQKSDFRQMMEFKRNGMSGDEIASRFGIDRVKEYNKAHPNNPIRTSKHSKLGASGFTW